MVATANTGTTRAESFTVRALGGGTNCAALCLYACRLFSRYEIAMSNNLSRQALDLDAPWISQDALSVEPHQIVAPDGSYDSDDVPDLTDEAFLDLYRWMLFEERYAERMVKLQRRGELGTFGSSRGHEASIVGSGYALEESDWLLGMGRETTAMLQQGVSLRDMILFWRGVDDAQQFLAQENCMIGISVGGYLPLVTGIGWGMKRMDTDAVVTAHFGDGATSTGASHEAINFAGVLDIPAIFYCQNNQWAISTPFEKQTNANSIAQRAIGYGVDGVRVDGNDVLAVYAAMTEARELASQGNPVIVEGLTYRRGGHSTNDDPSRYRDDEEVGTWLDRDPIERYERFLQSEGLWDRVDRETLLEGIDEEFDAAHEAADIYGPRDIEEIFVHLYDEMPPALEAQMESFGEFLETYPEMDEHVDRRPKG